MFKTSAAFAMAGLYMWSLIKDIAVDIEHKMSFREKNATLVQNLILRSSEFG